MPVAKLLFSMAIPMMISMLVQAFYNVVDSFFVAKLSEDAFNAISLAFPLQNLMIAFGGGTAVGMNAILSRALGAKEQEAANKAANTGIFLAVCNFVVFMLSESFSRAPFSRFRPMCPRSSPTARAIHPSACASLSEYSFSSALSACCNRPDARFSRCAHSSSVR